MNIPKALSGDAAVSKTAERGSIPRGGATCEHCRGSRVLVVDNGFHMTNCFHCNPATRKSR
jgi:hypothetical protein